MNDIERLVAGLPRPSPSEELDSRIAALIGSEKGLDTVANGPRAARTTLHWPPTDGPRAVKRRLIVTVASTACAGLLGFVIGRHSVAPVIAGQTATIPSGTIGAVAAPDGTPELSVPSVSPRREQHIVNVQVPESEALVRFVMPAKRSAGLFGSGALEERTESTRLE